MTKVSFSKNFADKIKLKAVQSQENALMNFSNTYFILSLSTQFLSSLGTQTNINLDLSLTRLRERLKTDRRHSSKIFQENAGFYIDTSMKIIHLFGLDHQKWWEDCDYITRLTFNCDNQTFQNVYYNILSNTTAVEKKKIIASRPEIPEQNKHLLTKLMTICATLSRNYYDLLPVTNLSKINNSELSRKDFNIHNVINSGMYEAR